ncbi:hypothetical protein SEVIR_9G188232v4 [Setaria viridis]
MICLTSVVESVAKSEPTLGVGYRTPEKSHTVPLRGPSFTPEYDNITLVVACTTPQKSWSVPFCGSSCTPECDESFKPAVGMTFDNIESAKEFYRAYAAHVGFPVRVGQHKAKDGVVTHKRLYCSREGFRKPRDETQSEPECSEKRKCERMFSNGCSQTDKGK